MRSLTREAALALALVLAMPALTARAQRGVVHQRLAGVINPIGAEHMVAAGVRVPLGDPAEEIFAGAHLEVGAIDYTSPIDTRNGGYLQLSPLAFLVLRAEVTSIAMWSLDMEGAGFHAVDGYDADLRSGALDASNGEVATGVDVQLSAILQGAVRLGPLRPIVWSQLTLEHETLGDVPFHYSARHDRVLARGDWMAASSSMLLLELTLADGIALRAGAYDELRCVLASGDLSNQVGPVVALALERVDPRVAEILFLVRAGLVTDHARREGEWSGLAAMILRYDLGPL